jgi:hypothetical protein
MNNSRGLLLALERVCRILNPDQRVSHAILVGKLKAIKTTTDTPAEAMSPTTQRLRERIWE